MSPKCAHRLCARQAHFIPTIWLFAYRRRQNNFIYFVCLRLKCKHTSQYAYTNGVWQRRCGIVFHESSSSFAYYCACRRTQDNNQMKYAFHFEEIFASNCVSCVASPWEHDSAIDPILFPSFCIAYPLRKIQKRKKNLSSWKLACCAAWRVHWHPTNKTTKSFDHNFLLLKTPSPKFRAKRRRKKIKSSESSKKGGFSPRQSSTTGMENCFSRKARTHNAHTKHTHIYTATLCSHVHARSAYARTSKPRSTLPLWPPIRTILWTLNNTN